MQSGLMQLSLPADTRLKSASTGAAAMRSKATAAMPPSPTYNDSSKNYGKRRGGRPVSAMARIKPSFATDKLPAMPTLRRATSGDAKSKDAKAAATTAAPSLVRAKTESDSGSAPIKFAMPSIKRSTSRGRTRTDSPSREETATAEAFDAEVRLDPLASPVHARDETETEMETELEQSEEPEHEQVKAKQATKRFGMPSLLRTISKQPSAVDKASETAPTAATADEKSAAVDHPTTKKPPTSTRKFLVPSLRRTSTGSSENSLSSHIVPSAAPGSVDPLESSDEEETKPRADSAGQSKEPASKPRKFVLPSLLRSLTETRRDSRESLSIPEERQHEPAPPSPAVSNNNAQEHPPTPNAGKSRRSMLPPVPSTAKAARFLSGMTPMPMLRRVISTSKNNAEDRQRRESNGSTKAKTPSTAEEDSSDTNSLEEEEEMRSFLSMLQVPRGRRSSQLPLMATGQEEVG